MHKICVVGLGYVGLPLAIEFSKHYSVIGVDINSDRVNELNNSFDRTSEVNELDLKSALKSGDLLFSSSYDSAIDANIFIVTVPTPVDSNKTPDLNPLKFSSISIGKLLSKNDLVIYESTTYPGCTEEFCVPILEKESGLLYNNDFFVGYSPERINPGDKINKLQTIVKVISGSNNLATKIIHDIYSKVVKAGLHTAPSIKVAEASKAIENAQRDLNISFVNELAIIFELLDIDTNEVLEAAGTKWNFLKYSPGLVGGHCIGVDPYYLAFKSKQLGYEPQVILSGRKVNNSIPKLIVNKVIQLLIKKNINTSSARVAILGVTFKENCPDTRNSMVFEVKNELEKYDLKIDLFDPVASDSDVYFTHSVRLKKQFNKDKYSVIILAVPHQEYLNLNIKKSSDNIFIDVKGVYKKEHSDYRL